ncbi:MAG: ribosome small subunit-dependent GTPase A, partial [Planctomycetes bacterium]|nr:ribosome small subunit-dependent GTPase A [Planctomycetota bacterium]
EDTSALAVGDDVTVALTRQDHSDASDADRDRADGMILSRGPRRSALARPRPRSSRRRGAYDDQTFDKVIAANIDVLLIMVATRDPPLRHGLIDRYLIIAERGELTPLLVLNKIDLGRGDETVLADFETLGIDIFLCSAETGEGVEDLASALKGKRSVVAGASGVGKTTLINRMIPGADAVTRRIRGKDGRGRHTTSAAVVYDLPGGGMIVDTPGIRELGMELQPDELPWYFPEFEALAPGCRFNNCTHTHEGDCAVRRAVETGQIPARRYKSYLNILATLDQ